jgi:hypothetical protein
MSGKAFCVLLPSETLPAGCSQLFRSYGAHVLTILPRPYFTNVNGDGRPTSTSYFINYMPNSTSDITFPYLLKGDMLITERKFEEEVSLIEL